MVETQEAFDNLAAIAATPGLDGIYVGPADLSLGLSAGRLRPGFDREEPGMIAAIRQIAALCRAQGIHAGLHCGTADYAARAVSWGYDLVTVGGDVRLLAGAAAASLARFRDLRGERSGLPAAKGTY
jgi:4-hydroxy-2-oxoheptanedioate aldolase